MKIRLSFISNSSSTSHIISSQPNEDDEYPLQIKLEIDLSQYSTIIKNIDDLNEAILEKYSFVSPKEPTVEKILENNSEAKKVYDSILEQLSNNKVVLWCTFSNEDGDVISSKLHDIGIHSPNVKIKFKHRILDVF